MGTRNIEKLLTDLKNLPKQCAPEDFEEKLLQRIALYESNRISGETKLKKIFSFYFNPIYVPAFTIILVAVLIAYTLETKRINTKIQNNEVVEKATPVVQETPAQTIEPQKIIVPKKRDYVVKRDKIKLNLGPGVSLDEPDYSYFPTESKQSFIDFPFPNEPVTIRIPPPEVIFRQEFDRLVIPSGNKDSITITNSRRR